jgi:hypothetical protein
MFIKYKKINEDTSQKDPFISASYSVGEYQSSSRFVINYKLVGFVLVNCSVCSEFVERRKKQRTKESNKERIKERIKGRKKDTN